MRFDLFRILLLSSVFSRCGILLDRRFGFGGYRGSFALLGFGGWRSSFDNHGFDHYRLVDYDRGHFSFYRGGDRCLRGGSSFGSEALGFALTATHFTRIVRRTATADYRGGCFGRHFGDDGSGFFDCDADRCGFSNHGGGFHCGDFYHGHFSRSFNLHGSFDNRGWRFDCYGSFYDGFSNFAAAFDGRGDCLDFARLLAG